MPRHSDPVRLRHAKIAGSIAGLRDQIVLADPDLIERHRAEWPELWDRLDKLVELDGG